VTLCSFVIPWPQIPGLEFGLPPIPSFPPSFDFDPELPGLPPIPWPSVPGFMVGLPPIPSFPPSFDFVCPLDN
jgi:hypothetical protein